VTTFEPIKAFHRFVMFLGRNIAEAQSCWTAGTGEKFRGVVGKVNGRSSTG
jgi:hypothetical protein